MMQGIINFQPTSNKYVPRFVHNLLDTWATRFVALAGGTLLGEATADMQMR